MYKLIFFGLFVIWGISCTPKGRIAEREISIDALESSAQVETVYVTTVETVVETVEVVKGIPTEKTVYMEETPIRQEEEQISPEETAILIEEAVSTEEIAIPTEEAVSTEEIVTPTEDTASTPERVTYETPSLPMKKVYKVQIGAFQVETNADRLYNWLKEEYGDLVYIEHVPPYWKVRVGNYSICKEALRMRNAMIEKGYKDAWVVISK